MVRTQQRHNSDNDAAISIYFGKKKLKCFDIILLWIGEMVAAIPE